MSRERVDNAMIDYDNSGSKVTSSSSISEYWTTRGKAKWFILIKHFAHVHTCPDRISLVSVHVNSGFGSSDKLNVATVTLQWTFGQKLSENSELSAQQELKESQFSPTQTVLFFSAVPEFLAALKPWRIYNLYRLVLIETLHLFVVTRLLVCVLLLCIIFVPWWQMRNEWMKGNIKLRQKEAINDI